jgi:hypothetical protein
MRWGAAVKRCGSRSIRSPPMAGEESTNTRPLRLPKLGARVIMTVAYAFLAALAIAYYVREPTKAIVFFSSRPVMALVYWRSCTWVFRLRRRKK